MEQGIVDHIAREDAVIWCFDVEVELGWEHRAQCLGLVVAFVSDWMPSPVFRCTPAMRMVQSVACQRNAW